MNVLAKRPSKLVYSRDEEKEQLFSSVRCFADMLNENSTIVYNYLTRYLKRVYRCSYWGPHWLNDIQKVNRVNDLQELSLIMMRQNPKLTKEKYFLIYY